jgi:hypothetical protein
MLIWIAKRTVQALCSKIQDQQLSMANQRPLLPVFPGMSKPQHLVSKVKERRANKSQNLGGTCPDFTGKALDFWPLFFVVVLPVSAFWQRDFLLGSGPAKHCCQSICHRYVHPCPCNTISTAAAALDLPAYTRILCEELTEKKKHVPAKLRTCTHAVGKIGTPSDP